MSDDRILELDIPDSARDTSQSVEVLRVFIGDGVVHVILNPETFEDDVGEWGRLLSGVAHHIAHALAMEGQMPREQALSAVTAAFARGVTSVPEDVSGSIKGRVKH